MSSREEHATRTRLVVVELREERAEHLGRRQGAVGLGKIGAVAPVLAGAEEEHLDAGEAALLMGGEHVGLGDAARIDSLMGLDRREGREAVAQGGGALEIERLGGLLHVARELFAHRLAAAGEKRLRLAHQLGIVARRDLAGAGRRAALDLMQQARPRPALVDRRPSRSAAGTRARAR